VGRLRLDGAELGVGMEAADERDVEEARENDVVDVPATSGQDPRIVGALRRRADVRHARESSMIDRRRRRRLSSRHSMNLGLSQAACDLRRSQP
jgi:hypothetical protein